MRFKKSGVPRTKRSETSSYYGSPSLYTSFSLYLLPEVELDLRGPGAFLDQLENRLRERCNSVVIVADGAGANHMEKKHKPQTLDKGGNLLQKDIGMFLKNEITNFAEKEMECNIKYIDPSYMLQSIPADLICVEELCFCQVV